ncbi:MAG TPA: CRISPR-associated protein [Lentisphaeria bacterium]|nr:MAG: CRISPR-associated protein [Lentisphaerae bacterium GWF2_38_69]HBM16330.1 CRISPR-associated protein [Lentisphaeria bacterium]
MSINETTNGILKATGLLIIEVINSNPNGDPDRESDPRQTSDGRGKISPVSFKRKLRDLVQSDLNQPRGPVWDAASKSFNSALEEKDFCILENRGRNRDDIKKLTKEMFQATYWDARVFGTTFLESIDNKEDKKEHFIRTGVVQFGMGVSISPVKIERDTTTNKSGVEEGKDRGMAPLAYRIVQHGVYCMPFFINPTAAIKSGCQPRDIEMMLKLIPYAYSHNSSYIRTAVEIRHAWYVEHKSALGSCSDFAIISAITPTRKDEQSNSEPSKSWEEYHKPKSLPKEIQDKVKPLRDLMDERF